MCNLDACATFCRYCCLSLAWLLIGGCSASRPELEGTANHAVDAGQTADNFSVGQIRIPDGGIPPGVGGQPTVVSTKTPAVEARAVWVVRSSFKSAEDVRRIISTAAGAGFNIVYFQVRGAADAYYHSSYEPWAASLTGKLGGDPGWDPLQTAIDEAHLLGLELHAWINVCTAWKGVLPPGSSKPAHIMRTHPEWRVAGSNRRPMAYNLGYIFMNPANPAFEKHLMAVISELCSFYDLDGLHLDYARYPAADTSHDRIANRLFSAARRRNHSLTRAGWQRVTLTGLIARIRSAVHKVKPRLTVSAAVTGIYKDRWNWGKVTQGFYDFHQDSHAWANQHAVDMLVPMIYWPPTSPPGKRADFLTLVEDFEPLSKSTALMAGINVAAGDFATLASEIAIVRNHSFAGLSLFSYSLLEKRGWFKRLAEGPFKEKAAPRKKKRPEIANLH